MGIECFNCGASLELEAGEKIFRSEECPSCFGKVRVCLMCRFYDPTHYNECRESEAERVIHKDRANYCEYFSLPGGPTEEEKARDYLQEAQSLFKD